LASALSSELKIKYGQKINSINRYLKILYIISKMGMEDFEVQEDLGKGSFGCVVKVIRKSDGEVYAMKQVLIWLCVDQASATQGKR
jgi:serine/threonine protein kinase